MKPAVGHVKWLVAALAIRRSHCQRYARPLHVTTKSWFDRELRPDQANLGRRHASINLATVARLAGISRTFLYENEQARAMIEAARNECRCGKPSMTTRKSRHGGNGLSMQNRGLKKPEPRSADSAGLLLNSWGRSATWRPHIQTKQCNDITTENATLRRRVQQLEDTNRGLDERLKAARENTRFMDRRLAEVEAQLVETPMPRATARR
jgi:hypothetical protein